VFTQLSYWSIVAFLFICATPRLGQTEPSRVLSFHPSAELVLYLGPDESSAVVTSVKREQTLSPVAETLGAEGAKWYLVKTNTGVVGWIKKSDSDESKKLEEFFRARPVAPPAINISDPPSASSPPEPSGTTRVPLKMSGSSVLVPVTLNRRLKTFLALDTGATSTMISHRVAKTLGLRTDGPRVVAATVNGQIAMPLVPLGSIKVGDAEIHNLTVTVHDLSPAAKIDGLLGLDFLKRFHVELDSRNQLLILAPR
jgi:clan AA aspartic protease (TIGR02281 family)